MKLSKNVLNDWIWKTIPFTVFIVAPFINEYLTFILFLLSWFIIPFIRGYFKKDEK